MVTRKKYLYRTLLPLVVIIMMDAKAKGKDAISLEDYTWKNRLILAFAPSSEDPVYNELLQALGVQEKGIIDRDILVFRILETAEARRGDATLAAGSGDCLRERYSIEPGKFTTLLIGKDGGEKLRRKGRVDLAEIFSLIDSMPIRQREMREKAKKGEE